MRLLIAALVALLPQAVLASCEGRDLRASLSPETQAMLDRAAATTPFAEGNRWRASRGDRVVDLVGTIHIPDPRLAPVLARLTPEIEAAERLFLEAVEEDRAALQRNLAADSSLLLLQDTSLPELLSEEDWQALAAAARSRGLPAVMAAKMQPWYLSMVLALPGCAMDLMADGGGSTPASNRSPRRPRCRAARSRPMTPSSRSSMRSRWRNSSTCCGSGCFPRPPAPICW